VTTVATRNGEAALAALQARCARALGELDIITAEIDRTWAQPSLRARRSRLAALIDHIDRLVDQAGHMGREYG
jgi:Holliday junction resolvase-like predicted endonuclease